VWKEANGITKHLPKETWESYEHLNLGKNRSGPRFELGSSAVRCVPQPTAMFSFFVFKLYHFIVFPQTKSKGRYLVLQPFQNTSAADIYSTFYTILPLNKISD
jgi:hypothetical protein